MSNYIVCVSDKRHSSYEVEPANVGRCRNDVKALRLFY